MPSWLKRLLAAVIPSIAEWGTDEIEKTAKGKVIPMPDPSREGFKARGKTVR